MSGAYCIIEGLDKLSNYIEDIDLKYASMLDAIGNMIVDQTQNRIDSEKRSPKGKAWAPHSAAYKKTRHANQGILDSTGRMRASLTYAITDSGTAVAVGIGSNLKYAATHQYGRDFFSRSKRLDSYMIPARPYLGLSDDNITEIVTMLNDRVTRMLGAR